MKKANLLLAALAVALGAGRATAQDAPANAASPKPAESAAPRDLIVAQAEGGYTIEFDLTETPDLKPWVEKKLKPACVEWYPKIVKMLPSEGFEAPKKFPVIFRKNGRGVAATGGTRVTCDYPWFSKNLNGEAAGAVIHELVHVVQQYGRARRAQNQQRPADANAGAAAPSERPRRPRNPGWLVEGLADWIRWFNYEPENLRPRPNPERAKHTDSYRTTAHFLNYVVNKYDKELIPKLNAAMREGKYDEAIWKQLTGKTLDELGAEWKESLKAQAPAPKPQ